MPDLLTSLHGRDLGYLRIVADLWGIELRANETDAAAEELSASILDPGLVRELTDSLSPDSRAALEALAVRGGRIPWAEFTRLYGEAREMGAGKRDREKPYLQPASPAEALFYRGMLARAFFDTPGGPREFAYLPEDLFQILPVRAQPRFDQLGAAAAPPLGRPAASAERAHEIPASDRILDDATTLLAALRAGITPSEQSSSEIPANAQSETPIPTNVVQSLLQAAGLIKKSVLQPEPVRTFLEAPRGEALNVLVEAWRASLTFDELRQVPGLIFEGEWKNPSLETRNSLLRFTGTVPKNKWWSLDAFVQAVKEKYPDFQRPAGEYDSWFIKRPADGRYLRGFSSWDEVDGALIRYFIRGILHWLGMVDLACAKKGGTPSSFRLSSFKEKKEEPFGFAQGKPGKISISSNGSITVPRFAPRAVRYQIARFCEWDAQKGDDYRYHVSPASLNRAKEQGLKVEHLLPLLAKHSPGIPPSLVKALKRWEVNGTEARIQNQAVLRVARPEVLEEMRKSKAARYLGEILSPTAVIIKDGAQAKVMAALTELGLLAEVLTTMVTKEHEGK